MIAGQKPRLAIGLATLVLAGTYLVLAQEYPWGVLSRPGPRVFPTLIGVALLVVGALVGVEALRKRNLDEGESRADANNRTLLAMIVLSFGFFVALTVIGFTISSMMVVLGLLRLLDPKGNVRTQVLYSVGLVLGTELVFTWIFKVSFPGGLLHFLR